MLNTKIIQKVILATFPIILMIFSCSEDPIPLESLIQIEVYRNSATEIEVIIPKQMDTVEIVTTIVGKIKSIDSNYEIRPFVRERDITYWYIQKIPQIDGPDWVSKIIIGGPKDYGKQFDIIVVGIKKSESDLINKFWIYKDDSLFKYTFDLKGNLPPCITVIRK